MTRVELIRVIRQHKGKIYAGLLGRNDCYYVQVVKSDLLTIVENITDNELETRFVDGALYLDSYTG